LRTNGAGRARAGADLGTVAAAFSLSITCLAARNAAFANRRSVIGRAGAAALASDPPGCAERGGERAGRAGAHRFAAAASLRITVVAARNRAAANGRLRSAEASACGRASGAGPRFPEAAGGVSARACRRLAVALVRPSMILLSSFDFMPSSPRLAGHGSRCLSPYRQGARSEPAGRAKFAREPVVRKGKTSRISGQKPHWRAIGGDSPQEKDRWSVAPGRSRKLLPVSRSGCAKPLRRR